MMMDAAAYYDALLAAGQDPVLDPPALKEYMDGWDGDVFLSQLMLSPSSSVLEIGIGTGRLAVRTAPLCGRFLGLDIAPETVACARMHLSGFSHAEALCADFLSYQFSDRFDVVYSSLTWMHIVEKEKALARVAEVLLPGGRFVLSLDKGRETLLEFGEYRVSVYPDSPDATERLLLAAGFESVERITVDRAHILVAVK